MANKHATLKALFDAIAAAIRTKTGSTDKIIADNFPDAITAINTSGDFSQATLTSSGSMLNGVKAYGKNGTLYTGSIVTKTSNNISSSGNVVTIPAGYYASSVNYTCSSATSNVEVENVSNISLGSTYTEIYPSSAIDTLHSFTITLVKDSSYDSMLTMMSYSDTSYRWYNMEIDNTSGSVTHDSGMGRYSVVSDAAGGNYIRITNPFSTSNFDDYTRCYVTYTPA